MNERLKALRKSLNLTQKDFAEKIGIKRNTLAKYETGVISPSTAVVSLICRVFNVNEDCLDLVKEKCFFLQEMMLRKWFPI